MSRKDPQLLAARTTLGRFVDSLLQCFEDRRPGLSGELLRRGEREVQRYFEEVYTHELPRLEELIRDQAPHLTDGARQKLYEEVDGYLRKTTLPAYVREAALMTPRERNDFYAMADGYHGLERAWWTACGILVGALVIWAPFIPLWSKEWVIPFMLAGLFFPEIRRARSIARYESRLNGLVNAADRELARLDRAYLTSHDAIPELAELDGLDDTARRSQQRDTLRRANAAEAAHAAEVQDPDPRRGE